MSYAGIQMFMDKLNQIINSNDIPLFNNTEIICERPQFQLLYEELGSMIQILFIQQHQDLEQLIDLKQRFIHAAEEAEYNVDLFLSSVHVRNNSRFPTSWRSFKSVINQFLSGVQIRNNSLKLDDVRRSLKSVEKSLDEINLFVGIDRDTELIRDKLVEDQKNLDVVSIVGMGGIGKTTLAAKVFNDGFVKYHFHVRVWVTVSQTYDKHVVLTQILESIRDKLDLEKADDSKLRELVHKNLMGKRYLIVIDDIWDIETWDNLKVFFPHNNTGSRILLTSRLTEVAKHACLDGLIHHLGGLNKEKGWELLCEKVFHGSECPKWSIIPGMKIVENCKGLPLAVVVIAGVLASETLSEKFWVKIAEQTGMYIAGEQNGCMETLGLSYSHLPLHLRECFLYLGGFPEDYKFEVQRLIWLWVAEGFIQQDGNRRLEDIADGYLMDLVDRNLVIVAQKSKSNGGVKGCKVHDLIRELCLKKANEEQFILKIERLACSFELNKVKKPPYRPERMFTDNTAMLDSVLTSQSVQNCRSFLVFGEIRSLGDDIAKDFCSFVLLRVLNLQKLKLNDFPKGMELLVHLRYLAIRIQKGFPDPMWMSSYADFPDSICKLWNLQTLIYTTGGITIHLPGNISDLVNLRHLWSNHCFELPPIERPMKNLQSISKVQLGDGVVDNLQKCFPYIKKLKCFTDSEDQKDFQSLIYLENLNLTGIIRVNSITFPATLKKLTLRLCKLPWSEMSIISQSLPNLQVLKLEEEAFEGRCWNTDGQEFPHLQFLTLWELVIKEWEAYSSSFPCLRQLQIINCLNLEEIPLEFGDIPTLELIQIKGCRRSVGESVRRIEEDQHDNFGNYALKIHIRWVVEDD